MKAPFQLSTRFLCTLHSFQTFTYFKTFQPIVRVVVRVDIPVIIMEVTVYVLRIQLLHSLFTLNMGLVRERGLHYTLDVHM